MRGTGDPYFNWLCMLTGVNPSLPGRNYTELIGALHEQEFHPKLALDANRSADGMQLRVEFISEHGPWGTATNRGPCTMLEFLVGLAKRMSFLTYGENNGGQTEIFFWQMMNNLGLTKATDDRWITINGDFFVEDACWRINERQYGADGSGGLFPLRCPGSDQRQTEIWYQMNAWMMENSGIGDL